MKERRYLARKRGRRLTCCLVVDVVVDDDDNDVVDKDLLVAQSPLRFRALSKTTYLPYSRRLFWGHEKQKKRTTRTPS